MDDAAQAEAQADLRSLKAVLRVLRRRVLHRSDRAQIDRIYRKLVAVRIALEEGR